MSDTPSFWRKDHLRVFLSHLASHKDYASEVKKALVPLGISCFVAHDDIEPTSEWQNEIEAALKSCHSLVALLHPHFHESKWTDQEIGFVMGRDAPAFAVRLGETPYGFIGRFQAFNGINKPVTKLAEELFGMFCKHKKTAPYMSEALLCLFEKSNSFADANKLIGYLERLQYWKPSYVERIREAVYANSQISGSSGVASRVDFLAIKWSRSH